MAAEKERLVEESCRQTETLRRGMPSDLKTCRGRLVDRLTRFVSSVRTAAFEGGAAGPGGGEGEPTGGGGHCSVGGGAEGGDAAASGEEEEETGGGELPGGCAPSGCRLFSVNLTSLIPPINMDSVCLRTCGGRVPLPEQDACDPPLGSNLADRNKVPKTTGRKRKSCEVEVCMCVPVFLTMWGHCVYSRTVRTHPLHRDVHSG